MTFGVRPSGGSVGDAYDNALRESFFATLECELLDRERSRTPAHARRALFDYIEGWYNPRRRHSALGYESPVRYERLHAARALRGMARQKSRAVEPPGSMRKEGGPPAVVDHEPTVSTPSVCTSAVHRPRSRGNFTPRLTHLHGGSEHHPIECRRFPLVDRAARTSPGVPCLRARAVEGPGSIWKRRGATALSLQESSTSIAITRCPGIGGGTRCASASMGPRMAEAPLMDRRGSEDRIRG